MRLRRREINVFSMSALDLFASGMGAFILLAVMALPFFPNTGDSKERIEEVKEQLAEARQERDAARERATRLEDALANVRQTSDANEALAEALNDALRKLEEAERKVASLSSELAREESRERELEQASRDLELALEEARKQRDDARTTVRELESELTKVKMPDLDVVICLDVTASMTEQIDGLKREIATLAQVLDGLAPSAGIGVIAFGDRAWQQPIHDQPIVPTSDLAAVQRFVASLTPNMDPRADRNNDGPEMVATALEWAVGMNWRTASQQRYVIVVTDNAAYPEKVSSALRTARSFSSSDGQFVSSVRANFTQNRADRQAADQFLRQLASAGKGEFVDAAGGESMIGSVLLAILGT